MPLMSQVVWWISKPRMTPPCMWFSWKTRTGKSVEALACCRVRLLRVQRSFLSINSIGKFFLERVSNEVSLGFWSGTTSSGVGWDGRGAILVNPERGVFDNLPCNL